MAGNSGLSSGSSSSNAAGNSHTSFSSSTLYSSSGVSAHTLMHLQEQGELQRTDQPLDLALDGDGLLLVKDKSGTLGGARTGAFHLTKEGHLQDAKGLTLQGWPLLPEGAGSTASATGSTGTGAGVSTSGGTGGTPSGVSTDPSGAGALGSGTADAAAVHSSSFIGPLGDLEDVQLMRPEVVPAPLVEAPHPYGTGLAIRKEANGLYSLHSSASWPRDSLEEVNALRTFVDSLGNEHATDMRIRQCYGSILLEFYDVRCDYSPETGWTNQDAYSNALDEATQQIVIPFPDTGATLTLNLSDITIATSERFSLTSGDTLPWKFPQMIVEEGTYMIERILECELGERLGRSTLTVERNEDGSFTERLSGGTLGFDIEFCFDEEGRISGYTFLRNASSTDDPSVGIQQSGSFVKDVHFVGSSTGTDFGTYDFDFSSFQIVNRTGSDLVINGNTIKPEASSGEAESTSAASGTSPLEAFSAMVSPSSLSIDENGVLKRLRSDGDWKPVYLLACGQFAATDAAEERNGVYYATPASGALKIGASGRDGMGTITAGALERSTTDLAHELSEMIRAQHAYAANTKVLSTIDDMLTELERL
ncbi:MAG: hypothetical protein LBJ70_05660 [Holosporales bacterium]|nr:hypothetical protein [Holosporales bacterium]